MDLYGIFNFETNNIGVNLGLRFDYKTLKSVDNTVTSNMIFNVNYDKSFSHPSFSSGLYYKMNNNIRIVTQDIQSPHFSELFSMVFTMGQIDLK